MTSTINANLPAVGSRLDSSVLRARFAEAKNDIEASQAVDVVLHNLITALQLSLDVNATADTERSAVIDTQQMQITGLQTSKVDATVFSTAFSDLLGGVEINGNSLGKLFDLITGLQSSKLNANAYNDHFKGLYSTLANLQDAHPSAAAGDYAQVDSGSETLHIYSFDMQEGWVLSSAVGSSILNTDQLLEGSMNLYFTAERAIEAILSSLPPSYSVTQNTVNVNEGNDVIFSISTENFGTGTLYYTVLGITAGVADLSSMSGAISVVNNSGTLTLTAIADHLTEGAESFCVQFRKKSIYGEIICVSDVITINDTSIAYDLLLHFDTFPFVDSSGKNTISNVVSSSQLQSPPLFGSHAFSQNGNPIFVNRIGGGNIIIPADVNFTFKWSELTDGSNGAYGVFGYLFGPIYSLGNGYSINNIGTMLFEQPTDSYVQYALERYDGILYFYAGGALKGQAPYHGEYNNMLYISGFGTHLIDEVMLLIGTAQAGGADSYAVETSAFS